MRVTRMTFSEIARKGRRVYKDPTTGKRRTEVVKFYQTCNPFNVDANGVCKSPAVILSEVTTQLATWIAAAPEGEKRTEWFS